jgi:two-component system chemotaxis response regulator CheY
LARKILLADDSVTAQNMGRKILADAGYEVITVNNGSAALKKIAEHKPDLIVLDVYMPGYSGLEVCQRLKEAQETSRVPVLLTVGKLEPFKPEEAKRARADGFIVKPFEASELLSALSKLEDKIVPRPESSKPGRFARANAALDEAKYDKTVAVEEDSGWKNRIVFPKKKDKAQVAREEEVAREEADESSYYNPMNKDLRTVLDRRPIESPQAARQEAEEGRVDLGALTPEGLPKDVTPEEIAALAAAAAQVKGKSAEAKFEEAKNEVAKIELAKIEEVKIDETKAAEAKQHDAQIDEAKVAQAKFADAEIAEEKIAEEKIAEPVVAEAKPEMKVEATPAAELPQEIAAVAPPVATFAEQKSEEKIDPKIAAEIEAKVEAKIEKEKIEREKIEKEKPSDAASFASPTSDDLMAAIAALEPDPVPSTGAGSGNGSWLHDAAGSHADEPVTMALAAAVAAGSGAVASRWTAVAVALAPEESSISLELEMQKAGAAWAAAEAAHAPAVAPLQESPSPAIHSPAAQAQETQPVSASSAPALEASAPAQAAPAETAAPEAVASVPATPAVSSEPGATPAFSTFSDAAVTNDAVKIDAGANDAPASAVVSNAAAEAITEAVKELEAKAAAYAEQIRPPASLPESAPVEDFKVAFPLNAAAPVPSSVETRLDEIPALESTPAALEVPAVESVKAEEPQTAHQELRQPEVEAPKIEEKLEEKFEQKNEPKNEAKFDASIVSVAAKEDAPATAAAPETALAFIHEVPAESASAQQVSSNAIASPAVFSEAVSKDTISLHMAAALDELAAGGMFDMAKKESEIAATTAAAWASWRRIRETGDKTTDSQKEDSSAPQDGAAMAVAAGAEKAPEGAHAGESESDDIAGIVDSVLADLRPKIVEEISRKMGKKK